MEVAAGARHLKRHLSLARQRALVDACRTLVDGEVPGYVPVVRGGGKMHVRMLCLGRHWNGMTYRYEEVRSDYDRLPVPPLPAEFRDLARDIAQSAGMKLDADLCILNYYEAEGRMGLHQDIGHGHLGCEIRSLAFVTGILVAADIVPRPAVEGPLFDMCRIFEGHIVPSSSRSFTTHHNCPVAG